jgi:hypothetical protein
MFVSGGNGSGSKLPLGIARGQGRIVINYYENPIHSDNAGPNIPADVQDMGKDAQISVQLSQVDPAVLDLISTNSDAPDVGTINTMGLPMNLNSAAFRIHIPSNYRPWTFYSCKLRRRGDGIGTEYSLIDLDFYAWAPIGNMVNSRGARLFAHVF